MSVYKFVMECLSELKFMYDFINLSWWKENAEFTLWGFFFILCGGGYVFSAMKKGWK